MEKASESENLVVFLKRDWWPCIAFLCFWSLENKPGSVSSNEFLSKMVCRSVCLTFLWKCQRWSNDQVHLEFSPLHYFLTNWNYRPRTYVYWHQKCCVSLLVPIIVPQFIPRFDRLCTCLDWLTQSPIDHVLKSSLMAIQFLLRLMKWLLCPLIHFFHNMFTMID